MYIYDAGLETSLTVNKPLWLTDYEASTYSCPKESCGAFMKYAYFTKGRVLCTPCYQNTVACLLTNEETGFIYKQGSSK